MKIYKTDTSTISLSPCLCKVDRKYFLEKYGYELNEYEINYYHKHTLIWSSFLKKSTDEWLMVYDDKVKMHVSPQKIEQKLITLPQGTELFFPYDKLVDLKNVTSPQLSGTRLGFYWGSHIYFISRKGVEKMLKIKNIKQPLDETFLDQGFSENLNVYYAQTNWFSYDESKCESFLARRAELSKAVMSQHAWMPFQKETAVNLLRHLIRHADRLGIKLYLHAGTLLGGIRHGGQIMPWDDDIDIAILEEDLKKMIPSIEAEGIIRVTPWVYKKTGNTYYKFWLEGGEKVEGYEYSFPFIDFWILYPKENNMIDMTDGYTFHSESYLSGRQIEFENCKLFIPSKPKVVLNAMYNDWDKYIKVFSWCHRLKKPLFKKYVLPIEVNIDGKLVNVT